MSLLSTLAESSIQWRRLASTGLGSDRENEAYLDSVIMDVMNVEQAKIAEEAGASAVMALGRLPSSLVMISRADQIPERIPANIRRDGGVARMVRSELALKTGFIY